MKKIKQNVVSLLMVGVLLGTSGCGAKNPGAESTGASEIVQETEAAEPSGAQEKKEDRKPGDTIGGFTLETVEESALLNSTVYNFYHEQSGARLVYLQNEDKDMAFSIAYHTPCVDETDMNHIFEHAIIASSEKYPSKDMFFDMAAKSYNTFINAFTYNNFTAYPVSSQSEEQLMKMADAYLSCMVAPEILTNENFFKREALRYELYEKKDPITMTGTVFSEDFGYLTDISMEAYNNIADALYPGEYTANGIGRMHRNYQDLTYENTIKTYERFYHFDNSLIFLYGDMDYEKFMNFIEKEYLSKAEKTGTDVSKWIDPATEPGHVEKTVACPAYEGDRTEGMTQIDYGIDVSQSDWTEILQWEVLTSVLSSNESSLGKALQEAGISSPFGVSIDDYSAKPYLSFTLYNTEEELKNRFSGMVQESLQQTAEEGVAPELLASILKAYRIELPLLRDQKAAGVNCLPMIANYWSHTGDVRYFTHIEEVLEALEGDKEQKTIKSLAKKALEAERTALVATVPTPGLAEEIEAATDEYLAEMKASMTEEELEQLIRDTEEFNEWNALEKVNNDFMISPEELPEPDEALDYTVQEKNGLTVYQVKADTEELAKYALYLDTTALDKEQTNYLNLYLMLTGEMATSVHTAEEIETLSTEYLAQMDYRYMYPGESTGDNHHPMLRVQWYGLAEDFEQSLSLLLEILSDSDTTDGTKVSYLLSRDLDSFDPGKANAFSLTMEMAGEHAGLSAYSRRYANAVTGPEFYEFLKEIGNRLEKEPQSLTEISEKMKEAAELMLVKGRVLLITAAPESQQQAIAETAIGLIGALPQGTAKETPLVLPETAKKRGVKIESSDYHTAVAADLDFTDGMKGSYFPFIAAVEDRYLIPMLRFQMGAYGAAARYSSRTGLLQIVSYNDPNVGDTIDVLMGIPEALRSLSLTEEDLDGYILNSYGSETANGGMLTEPVEKMTTILMGGDLEESARQIRDIRNADLSEKEAAADMLEKLLSKASLVTAGNEKEIDNSADYFDEILDYRTGK